MRIQLIILGILISLGLPSQSTQSASGWKGILPLRSTRKDAERMLGQPTGACRCFYRFGGDRIIIDYSDEVCHPGGPDESKIPKDTVTYITVYPEVKPKALDLKLDGSDYERTEDREIKGLFYYSNPKNGITVAVDLGIVSHFYYGPVAGESIPSCSRTAQ